jgi:hypothetical protein
MVKIFMRNSEALFKEGCKEILKCVLRSVKMYLNEVLYGNHISGRVEVD